MTGAKDARLDSTKLPFEMLASDFKLSFDGNNSTLSGELRTPKGGISFSGAADWRTFSESRAVVTVKSDDLRVVLPPEIELDLSTNVRCEASSERIKLDGLISLPWARVSVSSLPPSTVDVSDDVVRTDRPRLKKKDKGESIPIESNLFIRVGDDVRVEAMGLKARLTGELHVIQDKGNLGLSGQITIPNGRFKAYGQDLIVRRGQFQFSGEANNPALDLEAIRNPERTADDVIAGVRVSGTANFPRVAVFSEPEKSETEALSYLLRGAAYTVELTVITAVLGLILGTGLALCRLSTSRILSEFSRLYTNLMRAVPLVLVLFWFFLLMPEVLKVIFQLDHPVMIGADLTAIITFVLFEAAYFAEIMRAGIQSVSKGQMSASMALGLTYAQTMRYVVLPQAVRNMLPVLLTQTIILFQDTSLVYVISGTS